MSRWPYNTSTWQRLRQAKLSAQPVCEACERRGRTVLAGQVDHIVAIQKGGPAFPPLTGLMSLCASCHNSKTARMDRRHSKGVSGLKGCDVHGNPLDDGGGWWAAPAPAGPTPAGFRSRQTPSAGTSGESNAYLLIENDSQQGTEHWV
ncbi:HNH endonuclease [Bosea thiooxidans]|nr:HNH endonuclease [Bosea sp. (in: a-proteobacteria)]